MNENDVHHELADRTAHLTMDRPVGDILARGDRLRRRRRTAVAGSVVALGAVAAVTASALTPPGSSPLAPPPAYAAWGPTLVNLEPDAAPEIERLCADGLSTFGLDVTAVRPVAADTRDGETVAVYALGRRYGFCALHARADGLQPRATSVGRRAEALGAGEHVAHVASTFAQETLESPTTDGAGALLVSPEVTRVTVEAAGETFDAAVGGGFAMFWLPDGLSQAEVDAARATAYGAAGEMLADVSLM